MNKKGLASLVEGLPPTYWLIWTGTLINRLGADNEGAVLAIFHDISDKRVVHDAPPASPRPLARLPI